jgi:site-specific DNA-cytosine methylase
MNNNENKNNENMYNVFRNAIEDDTNEKSCGISAKRLDKFETMLLERVPALADTDEVRINMSWVNHLYQAGYGLNVQVIADASVGEHRRYRLHSFDFTARSTGSELGSFHTYNAEPVVQATLSTSDVMDTEAVQTLDDALVWITNTIAAQYTSALEQLTQEVEDACKKVTVTKT